MAHKYTFLPNINKINAIICINLTGPWKLYVTIDRPINKQMAFNCKERKCTIYLQPL